MPLDRQRCVRSRVRNRLVEAFENVILCSINEIVEVVIHRWRVFALENLNDTR